MVVTLETVKQDQEVNIFIRKANENLAAMGFTDHSFRHVNLVSDIAAKVLQELGFPARETELAAIAGYLHDIGNVVSRHDHGQSGALLAYQILNRIGMPPDEIAMIMAAIGNHEEQYGQVVNNVAAALILADKSDVNRNRVRNQDFATFDIHDRVNFAVKQSQLNIDGQKKKIIMELTIDLEICSVMEYFEIFLSRMVMCRRAADFLNSHFQLVINQARLL